MYNGLQVQLYRWKHVWVKAVVSAIADDIRHPARISGLPIIRVSVRAERLSLGELLCISLSSPQRRGRHGRTSHRGEERETQREPYEDRAC